MKQLFSGRFFNILVYASILFLIMALIRADYLSVPKIYSTSNLVLSFPLLMLGFYFFSLSWSRTLDYGGIKVSHHAHIAGNGLVEFGKYIPGKLWGLIGRAAYAEKHNHIPMGQASILSFKNQLMVIWAGFFTGLVGSMIVLYDRWEVWLGAFVFLILTPPLFSQKLADSFAWISQKIIRKKVTLEPFDIAMVKKVMPTSIFCWLAWSAGFYLMAQALVDGNINPISGLSYALATNIGIAAIFAPGGIGVREAVLVLYLNATGLSFAEATTISVASRLWYLLGESVFFVWGLIAHRLLSKT